MFGLGKKEQQAQAQAEQDQEFEERLEKVVESTPKSHDLVHPDAEGFVQMVTPKQAGDDLFMFKCAKCGHSHFRHAGYMQTFLPYLRPGGKKEMVQESRQVMICVKCKSAYIWVSEQMYDVTDKVDLQAWEETEKEAHKATGPGGQC